MKTNSLIALALATVSIASFAHAHGPVVQLSVENGKIVTRGLAAETANYNDANPISYSYVIPLAQRTLGDTNDGWYAQPNAAHAFFGPGIAYGNAGFAGGVTITETLADGLKRWDGTAFVDPGTEQIQGLRGSIATPTATLNTVDGGQGGSFSVTTAATVSATAHSQVYWRLLGDGVAANTASDDGVYLLTLQASTNQAGVTASDPFYFLLTKNATPADTAAAQSFVNTTLVPEPTVLAVAALGGLGLLARRRKIA